MGNSVAVLLLPYLHSKNDHNKMWFDAVIAKIKGCNFLPHSGLLELMGYLSSTDFLPSPSDILQAVDRGDTAALIILDLSAAYDTVDHAILLQRLQTTFGIDDSAYRWFQSYLSGRHQYVRRGSANQPSFTSSAVCLRVLCWDQFCSSCTPWS